ECVILAQADVVAWVPLGAALAHNDVAGAHILAAELLHAEALALTVAAVAGRAACFLMCQLDYFFRVFLAAALAGAAFFVDPVLAFAIFGSAFFAAGLPGAGFSVGGPTIALASC